MIRTSHLLSIALRADPSPPPPVAGAVTGAFQKLNPQAGDPIGRPRKARLFIGPQTHDQHTAYLLFLRGLGLDPSDFTAASGNGDYEVDDAAGLSSMTAAVRFGSKHHPPRLTLRRTSGATDRGLAEDPPLDKAPPRPFLWQSIIQVRYRPLDIYQTAFDEHKNRLPTDFVIAFYTLHQKNSESKLHGKAAIEF